MKPLTRYTPEILLFIYILLFLNFRHPSDNWDRIINSDGKGYYGYLTALFIYHDLDYKFIESYESKYYPSNRSVFKDYRVTIDGKIVNKCFPGIAILWLPFFLLAHFLSYLFGYPADGYSIIYQYSIAIAALFYFWLACKILMRFLIRLGAADKLASFITILIALGTNLAFFTIIESSMSHVYSFFLITAFIYAVFRFFESGNSRWVVPGALLLAMIILVRPTNGLVILLVPAMASKSHPFSLPGMLKRPYLGRNLVYGILLMAFLFSLPMLMWHHQADRWLVYSYGSESFQFTEPHFFSILFSYNRGWFVYTPIAFISLAGFIGIWKKDRSRFFWIAGFLLLFIYLLSSWWMWYYASKCGQRAFIDIYVLIAILLFYFYEIIHNRKFVNLLSAIFVLLTALNILQLYQHARFVFPAQYITRQIYWDSFFSLYPKARVFLPANSVLAEKSYFNNMEKDLGWINYNTVRNVKAYSGMKSSYIDHERQYSVGFAQNPEPAFSTHNRIVRVSAVVFPVSVKPLSSLVIDFQTEGKSICYNSFYFMNNTRVNHWTQLEFAVYVPENLPKNAIVKVYFYHNPGSGDLYIDDIKVDFLSLRDDNETRHIEGISVPCK